MNANYYDYMRVEDLKSILNGLPDDMLVVIPVIDEEDVNHIYGFRKVRTAGILRCETEECSEVVCLNGAADGQDILDQIHYSAIDIERDVKVTKLLYGDFDRDEKETT